MYTKVVDGNECVEKLLEGTRKTESAVGVTFGPKGGTVLIGSKPLRATKDGATVLRGLKLKDEFEDLALTVLRDASLRTMYEVGDGTTTTALLGAKLFTTCCERGVAPAVLDEELPRIVSALKAQVVDVNIAQVASTSSNSDQKVVDAVVQAYEEVGKDGNVIVNLGTSSDIVVRTFGGYTLDRGIASPIFLKNDVRGRLEFTNSLVCVFKGKVSYMSQITDVMSFAAENNTPIIIVAPSFEEEAAKYMLINAQQGTLSVAPIICDNQESLHDLAMYCDVDLVPNTATLENLRQIPSFHATLKDAVFTRPADDSDADNSLTSFIGGLRHQMSDTALSDDMRVTLQKRISNLLGKVASIEVGAKTDSEAGELKDRVDDAVLAVKSALSNGALPGMGEALAEVAVDLYGDRIEDPKKTGRHPLFSVLTYPRNVLLEQLNYEVDHNAQDSALAVIRAVENAFSAAKVLLSTKTAIIPVYQEEDFNGSV